ncbi:MAG: Dabb family protein [Clostridiales bacterium]|nr:Dabb family protein [Clostridiales bacterium]
MKSGDALSTYRAHPEHQKVLQFARSMTRDRSVVDYEIKS